MLHADGTHLQDTFDGGTPTRTTCRKDVLRLLKDDLDQFNRNNELLTQTPGPSLPRGPTSPGPSLPRGPTSHAASARDCDINVESVNIGSFFLKTTVLQLFEKRPKDSQWTKSNLCERYIEALDMVVGGLDAQRINHFFIKYENLMELSEYNPSQLQRLAEFFRWQQSNYLADV